MSSNLYTNHFGETNCIFRAPCSELKPYINTLAIYSTKSKNFTGNCIRPFPNGAIELFIHTTGNQFKVYCNQAEKSYQCFVSGLNANCKEILFTPISLNSTYEGFLVSLTYTGVCTLFKCRPCELFHVTTDINQQCFNLFESFIDKANRAADPTRKLNILEHTLITKLRTNYNAVNTRLLRVFNLIRAVDGAIPVEKLAQSTNSSYRNIHRLFQSEIGICPKEYLKIIRFNKACKLLSQSPTIKWSDIVISCGYYDQAHFIKDFNSQMGQSPQALLKHTKGKFYLHRPYLIV